MRWRTAAAPAVRRHYDTSGPARWCAGVAPAAHRPAVSRSRLKVFSQATTGGPLRWHGVGSRFPLKMGLEPTAVAREGCRSPSPSPGSGLPWSCCRQAAAPTARRGDPGPAPRRSRRTTALLHAPCSSKQAPVHPLRCGVRLAPVDSWQQQGHSHSKPKNLFSCKLSMKQFLGKGGPEVMLDDAV